MKRTALCMALAAAFPAGAVTPGADGLGQALIYPYYTVQSAGGDAFNTYISVVNHTAQAKALRVRFREGRLGREALSFNLFLSANDVWTGAAVPSGDGTRLVTSDASCTEPAFSGSGSGARFLDFRNDAFAGGSDDGAGSGLDRTREGFVEILEMGTLTGASAQFATHNSAGVPSNCDNLLSDLPTVAAPAGGLSGTLTLINVANGLDFDANAEALDNLASHAYFRRANDPSADFNATQVDPVSVVTANGLTYRSTWSRGVDAVAATLMRDHAMAEYVLDQSTASLTDIVITMPTRSLQTTPTTMTAPFTRPGQWAASCQANGALGEPLGVTAFTREEQGITVSGDCGFPECPPATAAGAICAASGVMNVRNNALTQFVGTSTAHTLVLGSATLGASGGSTGGVLNVAPNTNFANGWLDMQAIGTGTLVSRADSTFVRQSTGEAVTGPHTFRGLPIVGFAVRIFRNGTLTCGAGACQGNYGGAFPLKYRRNITPSG